MKLLQKLYPLWDPISTDAELCPVCDALIHISKEDKREIRKRAEDEKVGDDSFNIIFADIATHRHYSSICMMMHRQATWRSQKMSHMQSLQLAS